MSDLLAGASWSCAPTLSRALDTPDTPDEGDLARLSWLPADVPGTAAGARRGAGAADHVEHDYDGEDWWFRCRFAGQPGAWTLSLHGIATLADVWLNGDHLVRSESMFVRTDVLLEHLEDENELLIRCEALSSVLGQGRRPRPRWKTAQVEHQGLRLVRSNLLGRIPGWARTSRTVGPWRPVTLTPSDPLADADVLLASSCDGAGGRVDVTLTPGGGQMLDPAALTLHCDGHEAVFEAGEDPKPLHASLRLEQVERWWPHTHGGQRTYPVELRTAHGVRHLGRVGFRTVEVDQSDGGFRFVVNGEPVFVRGANWFPPDPVTLTSADGEIERRVSLARDANLNMLRVPGTTTYADEVFLRACDEAGILVWQDCMFAYMDYPDDEAFLALAEREARQAFAALSPHPAVAAVCGNQEVGEIAAMSGVPADSFGSELFDKLLPSLAAHILPGVVFVDSNPTGGSPLYRPDTGVSQYFGIGGYLRHLSDVRTDSVRFAAECLAFSTPPERDAVERLGGPNLAGHDPGWKRALHHDPGRSWDMEDLRAHYVQDVFGVDPLVQRYVDAERALDLGRATNALLVEAVFSEWRCGQPVCGGGLVLGFNDIAPGAGWGLIDVEGTPKAPWFALRRASASRCVRFFDRGLNGLDVHAFNEEPVAFRGSVVIDLYNRQGVHVDQATVEVDLEPRRSLVLSACELFNGFYDLNHAYRFAPPAYDVIVASLVDHAGVALAEDVFLPLGQGRAVETDVGLEAIWSWEGPDPTVRVSTRHFAQWVSVESPGYRPSDSWFHLAPGAERTVTLLDGDGSRRPRGRVRALNSATDAVLRPAVEP